MRVLLAFLFCALLHGQDIAEISGQVVDSATKQPVAGARVVLVRLGPGSSYSMQTFDTELSPESPDPAGRVFAFLTGDQGLFRCKVTAPAEFMIFASKPGYVKWGMSFETQRRVTIKPGEAFEPLTVPLDHEGAISGRIVDAETAEPVAGMQVVALRWRVFKGTRALMQAGASKATDANGAYEITGLAPGEYLLQAEPPVHEKFSPGGTPEEFRDHREVAYGRTYYPGVERREQASAVTLLPGATLASTHVKLARRRLACIRGRLSFGEGEQVSGTPAVVLGRVEYQGDSMSFSVVARGNLAVDSAYQARGLPPGRYWLQATYPKGAPQDRRAAFQFFELDDRNVDNVDLVLTKGVEVRGQATLHESVGGSIAELLKTGPAPRVSLNYRDRMGTGDDLPVLAWQPDGSFVFQGVMEGTYKVYASRLPAGLAVGAVRYNGSRQPRGLMTLNRSALDQKLELVLYPATASIQVSVMEGTRPAKDAQVALLAEDYDQEDPQREVKTAQTDANGRATFSNLIAGQYRVLAFAPDAAWRTTPALRSLVKTSAKIVDLAKGAAATVELKLTTIE